MSNFLIFPWLHIYVVTCHDNHFGINYVVALGKANIGNVKIPYDKGGYFVVNPTDKDIYLLSRKYTVIDIITHNPNSKSTSYDYRVTATDAGDLNPGSEYNKIIEVIKPDTYY